MTCSYISYIIKTVNKAEPNKEDKTMTKDIKVYMSDGENTVKIVKSISGLYITDRGTVTHFETIGIIKAVRLYRAMGYEII